MTADIAILTFELFDLGQTHDRLIQIQFNIMATHKHVHVVALLHDSVNSHKTSVPWDRVNTTTIATPK